MPIFSSCSKMSNQANMSNSAVNTLQTLISSDPILKFLANGGSWADAIEMEYAKDIPKWSKQLQAAYLKHSPSAKVHQKRLEDKLREAYSYSGVNGKAFEAIIESLQP